MATQDGIFYFTQLFTNRKWEAIIGKQATILSFSPANGTANFNANTYCNSKKFRFSKLPVITGPSKQFYFPFQMGASKFLKIVQ